MNDTYNLHSWSKLYRKERLAEASRRHLVERARSRRELRESGRLGFVWRNLLALLRRAYFSEQPSPRRKDAK
jgi:hypothetical protein